MNEMFDTSDGHLVAPLPGCLPPPGDARANGHPFGVMVRSHVHAHVVGVALSCRCAVLTRSARPVEPGS